FLMSFFPGFLLNRCLSCPRSAKRIALQVTAPFYPPSLLIPMHYPLLDEKSDQANDEISIKIKVLKSTESYTVRISKLDSIAQLKQRIAEASGIAAGQQRLLLKGKSLADGQLVMDYGIADGALIHLTVMNKPAAGDERKDAGQEANVGESSAGLDKLRQE